MAIIARSSRQFCWTFDLPQTASLKKSVWIRHHPGTTGVLLTTLGGYEGTYTVLLKTSRKRPKNRKEHLRGL